MVKNPNSYICKTRQHWKVNPLIQSGITIVSALFIFAPWFFEALTTWQVITYVSIGAGIALVGLIIRFSVRCPICKSYWYLRSTKSLSFGNIDTWLDEQEKCPVCGTSEGESVACEKNTKL